MPCRWPSGTKRTKMRICVIQTPRRKIEKDEKHKSTPKWPSIMPITLWTHNCSSKNLSCWMAFLWWVQTFLILNVLSPQKTVAAFKCYEMQENLMQDSVNIRFNAVRHKSLKQYLIDLRQKNKMTSKSSSTTHVLNQTSQLWPNGKANISRLAVTDWSRDFKSMFINVTEDIRVSKWNKLGVS